MIDTSVTLCGVTFQNPIITASGTYGFGTLMAPYEDLSRLGGICVKAVTLKKRDGNPPVRIAETASGILNAVGLQNPGVDVFVERELPALKNVGTRIIVNVAGAQQEDYVETAKRLRGTGIDMVELNISCPNVKEGGVAFGTSPRSAGAITAAVKKVCDVPLIVKLSPNVTSISEIARAVEDSGADCLSLINTLTGMAVDARTRRPVLKNITGGLSGPAIKPVALRMVYETYRAVKIPIIGMGGIMTGEDAAEFLLCGASAVMVGTANLVDPGASGRIARELTAFLQEQGMDRACALTGGLRA